MLNKRNFKIVIFVLVAIGSLAIFYYYVNRQLEQKIVWININKVYNDFSLKRELEAKFKVVESARKKILDSLELNLKIMANQINAVPKPDETKINRFEYLRQEFLNKKQQFEDDNVAMQNSYNEQIMKQINQYVKEYAEENNHSVILGAGGNGSLMYAAEKIDITEQIIGFINTKYKGN